MKPTNEQLGKWMREALAGIKDLDRDEFYKAIGLTPLVAEPKFDVVTPKFQKVGDEVWDLKNNREVKIIAIHKSWTPAPFEIEWIENGDVYHVYKAGADLSPLPAMYVGKKWTLDQPGNPWHGFEVECVREDRKPLDYEQYFVIGTGKVQNAWYPSGISNICDYIIRCYDPRFWTGEIEGEKVRCYEYRDSCYHVYTDRKVPYVSFCGDTLTGKLWLAAIKAAGIPIAPVKYFNEMIPPIREE